LLELVRVRIKLVSHAINLVRLRVMRGDHDHSGVVDVGAVVLLHDVALVLSLLILCGEGLEDSYLVHELGAALDVEENTLSRLFARYLVSWPGKEVELPDVNLVFSQEKLGISSHLLVFLLPQGVFDNHVEELENFVQVLFGLGSEFIKVNGYLRGEGNDRSCRTKVGIELLSFPIFCIKNERYLLKHCGRIKSCHTRNEYAKNAFKLILDAAIGFHALL